MGHYESRKRGEDEPLWAGLKPNKYGYWGKGVGNWYGRFNRKSVKTDPKKCFHSFRHTVADTLKQQGVDVSIISEILGHKTKNISTERYGKSYRPKLLAEALARLDYGILDE